MAQLIRSYNDTYAYEHDKAVYIYQSADINPREFNTEQQMIHSIGILPIISVTSWYYLMEIITIFLRLFVK